MIVVDANLLLYAENSLSEQHESARTWWDAQLSAADPVGLGWPVLTAFIRISTNPRLVGRSARRYPGAYYSYAYGVNNSKTVVGALAIPRRTSRKTRENGAEANFWPPLLALGMLTE